MPTRWWGGAASSAVRQRTLESKPIGRSLLHRFGPGREFPDQLSQGADEQEAEKFKRGRTMHTWRDIAPELSLGFYLVAWIVAVALTYVQSR